MHRFTFLLLPLLLSACFDKGSNVSIAEAYAFATAPSAQNGAIFMTIDNDGGADRLVSAASDVSERVEIHEMAMDGGTMKMRQLVDGLAIPANGSAELAPHGNHIMLMGLKAPLTEGDTFDVTLTFEKAGEMTFPVMISKPGQKPVEEGHDHTHEGHVDGDEHAHH